MPIRFYKKLGESSFGAVKRFTEENPEYADKKIAFAGRLDPMAEGEMILLTGEETKIQDQYTGLDKVYETEIILGIQTDSFDLMGFIKKISPSFFRAARGEDDSSAKRDLEDLILSKEGKQMQKFPPYSKRHVKGKAMFVWAREGRLDEIEIPEHEIEIHKIEILEHSEKTFGEIRENAVSRIKDVVGDFRQEDIIKAWQENPTNSDIKFPVIKLRITCGAGTYIRQFAEDLGEELGCGACVFSIKRTAILEK